MFPTFYIPFIHTSVLNGDIKNKVPFSHKLQTATFSCVPRHKNLFWHFVSVSVKSRTEKDGCLDMITITGLQIRKKVDLSYPLERD